MTDSFKSKQKRPRTIALLVVIITAAIIHWTVAASTSPTSALARAIELLEDEYVEEEIPSLLAIPASEKTLSNWAHLYLGSYYERKGMFDKAITFFKKVDSKSAATLDAEVGILRLKAFSETNKDSLQSEKAKIAALKKKTEKSHRKKLKRELLLIEGELELRNNQAEKAYHVFIEVRKSSPRSKEATRAREATAAIRASSKRDRLPKNPESLLEEVKLLLKEQQPLLALKLLQSVKNSEKQYSPDYLAAMLVEIKVLNALNRNTESDQLLRLISAHGDVGSADIAALEIAKGYWNINNNQRALQFLDKLRSRFPKSPLITDAYYIEARVFEELGQFTDARDSFLQSKKTARDATQELRSLRQIAWLYVKSENYIDAVNYFDKCRTLARVTAEKKELGRKVSASTLDTIDTELHHCTFWLSAFVAKLEKKKIALEKSYSPKELLSTLNREAPITYYGMLARKHLGITNDLQAGGGSGCLAKTSAAFRKHLKSLNEAKLGLLAQHEIDWHFSHKANNAVQQLTRINLSTDFGVPNLALKAARSLYFENKVKKECLPELTRLLFPTPFKSSFNKALGKDVKIVPLAYAITRTESHFDPDALSAKDARGLMQLLARTAADEGLVKNESLYDPAVNIRLGTKHTKRLLKHYRGEKIYAIAAYNAGAAAVNRWRTRYKNLEPLAWTETIGFPETKNYVKKVLLAENYYQSSRLSKP